MHHQRENDPAFSLPIPEFNSVGGIMLHAFSTRTLQPAPDEDDSVVTYSSGKSESKQAASPKPTYIVNTTPSIFLILKRKRLKNAYTYTFPQLFLNSILLSENFRQRDKVVLMQPQERERERKEELFVGLGGGEEKERRNEVVIHTFYPDILNVSLERWSVMKYVFFKSE